MLLAVGLTVVVVVLTKLISLLLCVFTDSGKYEQVKSLDAESSKDIQALLTHDDDDESEVTTAAPVTKDLSHKTPSSKRHSKVDMVSTKPSASVIPSSVALATENEALKNGSFLQASLGEINSNTQQNQLSSSMKDITPQDAPLLPTQDTGNTTENVCDND